METGSIISNDSDASSMGPFITHAKTKKDKKGKAEFIARADSPTMKAAMALEKFNQHKD